MALLDSIFCNYSEPEADELSSPVDLLMDADYMRAVAVLVCYLGWLLRSRVNRTEPDPRTAGRRFR
jgi:hypothetical protein